MATVYGSAPLKREDAPGFNHGASTPEERDAAYVRSVAADYENAVAANLRDRAAELLDELKRHGWKPEGRRTVKAAPAPESADGK